MDQNKKHYVNNKSLRDLLIDYKTTKSKATFNKIGHMFLLIAQNYCNKPNFINYTQDRKEEMISDACFVMVSNIDDFDVERSNAFAYFTRVVHNCFLQYIKKYKKQRQTFISLDLIESSPDFLITNEDNMNKYEKNNHIN